MSYDGIMLRAVTCACNELLVGSRIDKVTQPNAHEIILWLRNQSQNYKLLISSLPQEGRIQLTTTTPPNPPAPPLFCMVLRKHLEGGRILSFEQKGLDRIMIITALITNEMGDKVERQLIAEIMGKHSNIILVNPQKQQIIDSIHRVPASMSRLRQVLPGFTYTAPPAQNKLPLWEESADGIASRLLEAGLNKALDKLLLSVYAGVGPQTIQEILHRAQFNPQQTLEFFGEYDYQRLFQVIHSLGEAIRQHQYQPEVVVVDQKPVAFSAIALTQFAAAQRLTFDNVHEMLDYFYQNRGVVNLFRQKQADLEHILRKEKDRCEKKAGLQAQAIQTASEAQIWRLYGELLMAHQHSIAAGNQAIVPNFYEEGSPELTIPMEPALTPLENAKSYFKRYQKAQHTAAQAKIYYEETLAELAYIDSVLTSLDTVTELEELADIRRELQESGYLKSEAVNNKKANKKSPKRPDSKSKKAEKLLAVGQVWLDGFQTLYGKNNHQNDQVTMKQARTGDLWLHVQKIPSAHVIVRNPQRLEIPATVVEQAAKLCVWHSKARLSSQVPVDYTQRQNVWKPKGAKPGMVLYENYQTIFVTVEEAEINSLLNTNP